jgi:hypothetical protein
MPQPAVLSASWAFTAQLDSVAYMTRRLGTNRHAIRQVERDEIKDIIVHTVAKNVPDGALGIKCRFPATLVRSKVRCKVAFWQDAPETDYPFDMREYRYGVTITDVIEDGTATVTIRTSGAFKYVDMSITANRRVH